MTMGLDHDPMSLLELKAFLESEATPPECMSLSELDGFLTALAIGPETIPPSQWLLWIWGEDGPTFESDEQAEQVLGAIFERFNEISSDLQDEPEAYEPIFQVDQKTGETLADRWAAGFLEGIRLRPERWQPLIMSENSFQLLVPILALTPALDPTDIPADDTEADREESAAVQQAREVAPEIIPTCVEAIHGYFKETRRHFQGRTTLGRNDPCFCGSGKKFKKCCGRGRV